MSYLHNNSRVIFCKQCSLELVMDILLEIKMIMELFSVCEAITHYVVFKSRYCTALKSQRQLYLL
jgi:hypothetical protein